MDFIQTFRELTIDSINGIDTALLFKAVGELEALRSRGGRLFIAGSGGGAGHASHAAADFRRLTGIESYAIGDNVSELTALINDESWQDSYKLVLQQSRLNEKDMLLFFSVGGGDAIKNISANLVNAAQFGSALGTKIVSVVGAPGGFLAEISDVAILIPSTDRSKLTPITEALQAYVWHMLVSHPTLSVRKAMWESVESNGK
jgi:D-sedoheptulose 7-phosphate isomerase